MNANINIEVQIDRAEGGYINVKEFLKLLERLNIKDSWEFSIENDSCTYIRFHKNDNA